MLSLGKQGGSIECVGRSKCGWAHANIPIVVPAVPTVNAFQRVDLRDCCVHSSALVRTTFKEKEKKKLKGPEISC